eukprot:scaffold19_cov286-Prasinococcus_capsulatus_cf.AAC.1
MPAPSSTPSGHAPRDPPERGPHVGAVRKACRARGRPGRQQQQLQLLQRTTRARTQRGASRAADGAHDTHPPRKALASSRVDNATAPAAAQSGESARARRAASGERRFPSLRGERQSGPDASVRCA